MQRNVGCQFGDVPHLSDADIDSFEKLEPLGGGLREEDLVERLDDRRLPVSLGKLIGHELRTAQPAAELGPELRLQGADSDLAAVGRAVGAVAGVAAGERSG